MHLKVQGLSFNKNFISSAVCVPSPSPHVRYIITRLGKAAFTEKAKVVDSSSLCSSPESTGSNLQYDSYLVSVACSQTELSISENLGYQIKG